MESTASTAVDRVLVPYDGSAHADAAIRFAIETFPDAEIEVLHVVEPFAEHTDAGREDYRRRWRERAQRYANQTFERALTIADEPDRTVETAWRYGRPAHEIVAHLEADAYDHVVMGSRGRTGLERVLLGSVAETTLRRSPVPVTVVSNG